MAVAIEELAKLLLELPEKQRAACGQSSGFSARRRDRELEYGNSQSLSIEQRDFDPLSPLNDATGVSSEHRALPTSRRRVASGLTDRVISVLLVRDGQVQWGAR
jgi:hypothetical protein